MPTLARSRIAAGSALIVAGAVLCTAAASVTPAPAEWNFAVRLDGKPIGSHRFVLSGRGAEALAVTSEAQFEVAALGITFYRYRHRASERWSGGCLTTVEARTDDNGRLTEVLGQAEGDRFDLQVRSNAAQRPPATAPLRCVMSFAYWNPALAAQKQLLDPGSGRIESVAIAAAPAVPDDLRAQPVRGLRISGLDQPIDVWYVGDRWIGLDTVVSGGRRLSYRLD